MEDVPKEKEGRKPKPFRERGGKKGARSHLRIWGEEKVAVGRGEKSVRVDL